MTDADIGADVDAGEPWTKITQTVDEYAEEARATQAAQEAEAHAQVSEMFADHRRRLEWDLRRLERDLAIQRGEVH